MRGAGMVAHHVRAFNVEDPTRRTLYARELSA